LTTNKIKTGQTLASRRRAVRRATARNFQAVAEKSRRLNSVRHGIDRSVRFSQTIRHPTAEDVKKGHHARFPDSQQPFAFATG